MKKGLFLLLLVMCMPVCAWSAAVVPAQATQANASVRDPLEWDFGIVKAGVVLEHVFVLTNDSARDLVIKDTTTSCGCTVSEIKKKRLMPGESTELLVKFEKKGYNGATHQFVYVNTDNVDKPIVRFTVKASVSP